MSKLSDLGEILALKTKEKKVKWDLIDDETISTIIGQNSIIVAKTGGIIGDSLEMEIKNLAGQIVDREKFSPMSIGYDTLKEMMLNARRESLKADQTIGDLMKRLERL